MYERAKEDAVARQRSRSRRAFRGRALRRCGGIISLLDGDDSSDELSNCDSDVGSMGSTVVVGTAGASPATASGTASATASGKPGNGWGKPGRGVGHGGGKPRHAEGAGRIFWTSYDQRTSDDHHCR